MLCTCLKTSWEQQSPLPCPRGQISQGCRFRRTHEQNSRAVGGDLSVLQEECGKNSQKWLLAAANGVGEATKNTKGGWGLKLLGTTEPVRPMDLL